MDPGEPSVIGTGYVDKRFPELVSFAYFRAPMKIYFYELSRFTGAVNDDDQPPEGTEEPAVNLKDDGKMGAKKRAKMEAKAEKKAHRDVSKEKSF